MAIRSMLGDIPWLRWLARPGDSLVLEPGDRLGRFEIREALPRGGMGLAYRARDRELGRDVVLKILRPDRRFDERSRARFVREARTASLTAHPNIVTIFDLRKERGHHVLVMEYVRGRTLRDVIRKRPLEIPAAVNYALQIVAGLGHLHTLGIIHRDLKPSNLMVSEANEIKIVDFGISRKVPAPDDLTVLMSETASQDIETAPGEIVGTPSYMAPEQIRGQAIDPRTDLFAFGCVLFEMLTGQVAFGATGRENLLRRILHGQPEWPQGPPPDHWDDLRPIVEKCLEKSPSDRWESASEIETALLGIRLENESLQEEERDVTRLWRDLIVARSAEQLAGVRMRAERLIARDPGNFDAMRILARLERAALPRVPSFPNVHGREPRSRIRFPAAVVTALVLLVAVFGIWMQRRADSPEPDPIERVFVTGRVAGPDGLPISGALVTIDGHPFRVTTTTDGAFRAELADASPGEVVRLRVSHDSLATYTGLISVGTAGMDTMRIELGSLRSE